jgi:SAM-dependent methyltransferase
VISYKEAIACLSCGSSVSRAAFSRTHDETLEKLGDPQPSVQYRACRRCGLVFQNPRITPDVEARLYGDGQYHGFSEDEPPPVDYLERHMLFAEREVRWIMDTLGIASGGGRPGLDIGAGAGFGVVAMTRAGWRAVGVEPNGVLAAFGRRQYNTELVSEFLTDETLPGRTFSLMFSHQTFEHLLEPRAVLETARRKIEPDGYIFINVPTFRQCRQKLSWKWFNSSHICLFTHKSLGNLLGLTGFEVVAYAYTTHGELRMLAKPGAVVDRPIYSEASWLLPLEIRFQGLVWVVSRAPGWIGRRLGRLLRRGKQGAAHL